MGIGLGVILVAIGASLTWAVEFQVDICALGIILMIVGIIALIAGVMSTRPERTVVEDHRHVA